MEKYFLIVVLLIKIQYYGKQRKNIKQHQTR
jgi:hypothetical protein